MNDHLTRLALGATVCLGRSTITGLLHASGESFQDWSAGYRLFSQQRVEPQRLLDASRREVLASLAARGSLARRHRRYTARQVESQNARRELAARSACSNLRFRLTPTPHFPTLSQTSTAAEQPNSRESPCAFAHGLSTSKIVPGHTKF